MTGADWPAGGPRPEPDQAPATLEVVALGGTGLRVTRLMFGGAPIGGLFAPVSDADARATLVWRATLEAAWAAGIGLLR
jgi:aryl-alcohol dehydrogenase-like predicted oxidoreductase